MEKPLALAERDIEKALRSTRTGDVDDVEDLDCACGGQPTTSAGESKDVQQGRVSIGPNVLTVKVSTRAAKKQRPRNSRFANDLSVPKGMYLSVMGSYASISPSRMTLSLVSLARSAISGRGRTRRCRGRALRRGRASTNRSLGSHPSRRGTCSCALFYSRTTNQLPSSRPRNHSLTSTSSDTCPDRKSVV